MTMVPGNAVKNHLSTNVTGTSAALPANAANYSLAVRCDESNDGFIPWPGGYPQPPTWTVGYSPGSWLPPWSSPNEYSGHDDRCGGGTLR